ncbi:uncharacterized protein [Sinocyclocheilus grahami]|uniref:uncharacterized protein isoform X2 n=1 Tax=Sinocyclocheilus grahami TaxID=75366 RepID=UPI0007ACE25F|nr:PREDICTED: uncharacterized protein LOC107590202 isoform X2 [Sinocyclocheilus grahami]
MSTHDLKLQQSSCQSGVKASVTCFVPDQERLYTQTDKSRFQNVSEHEKLHPGPLAQHIHNKKDLETRTTASSPSLQLTGQQKSSRDLQIRQIILLRSKEDSSRTSEEQRKSARFTSTISISLPNRRNKKDTAEEKTLQATNSLYSTHEAIKNTANQNHTESPVQQNLVRSHLSSSCADLKYGLHNGRSFSVSSVVSSRPSGPGRISTSSISDLSSLDDFVPKGDYTVVDSPMSSSHSPICDAKSITGKQSEPGYTDDLDLDHYDADPTPPPSPTMSSSPRRISQAPSVSSPMWTTPEKSPTRGILSSRSYTTSLTVFEESDSDTTTDDEYYLDNCDDAVETEL